MLKDRHPFFICRKTPLGEMQYVHKYDIVTNKIIIKQGSDDDIFYFATDDLAVEAFLKIKNELPEKDKDFCKDWFVKESVRTISRIIQRGRNVFGYVPKKDHVKLTTKDGHTFDYVYNDLTDDEIQNKMFDIVLKGCRLYGIEPNRILSVETV